MEDALKRLDKLTQDEARMVLAHNSKAIHTAGERVREVATTVIEIDNKMTKVEDRVVHVDERLASVHDEVAGANRVIKYVANDANQVKRSSSPTIITLDYRDLHYFRKQIAEGHLRLALPTGSVNQPQHCV
jgi:hypothetical protein